MSSQTLLYYRLCSKASMSLRLFLSPKYMYMFSILAAKDIYTVQFSWVKNFQAELSLKRNFMVCSKNKPRMFPILKYSIFTQMQLPLELI